MSRICHKSQKYPGNLLESISLVRILVSKSSIDNVQHSTYSSTVVIDLWQILHIFVQSLSLVANVGKSFSVLSGPPAAHTTSPSSATIAAPNPLRPTVRCPAQRTTAVVAGRSPGGALEPSMRWCSRPPADGVPRAFWGSTIDKGVAAADSFVSDQRVRAGGGGVSSMSSSPAPSPASGNSIFEAGRGGGLKGGA
eukprot:327139-Prorocentrum_minimum.AAC.1